MHGDFFCVNQRTLNNLSRLTCKDNKSFALPCINPLLLSICIFFCILKCDTFLIWIHFLQAWNGVKFPNLQTLSGTKPLINRSLSSISLPWPSYTTALSSNNLTNTWNVRWVNDAASPSRSVHIMRDKTMLLIIFIAKGDFFPYKVWLLFTECFLNRSLTNQLAEFFV